MCEVDSTWMFRLLICIQFCDFERNRPRCAFGYFHSCRTVFIKFIPLIVSNRVFWLLIIRNNVLINFLLQFVSLGKLDSFDLLVTGLLSLILVGFFAWAYEARYNVFQMVFRLRYFKSSIDSWLCKGSPSF